MLLFEGTGMSFTLLFMPCLPVAMTMTVGKGHLIVYSILEDMRAFFGGNGRQRVGELWIIESVSYHNGKSDANISHNLCSGAP